MLGHGTPLWEPVGDLDRPEKHLRCGISIGDVGFLNDRGGFERFFNIFLPQDGPLQAECPPDFLPLEAPTDGEISVNPIHFPPGTALVSKGIEATTLSSSPLYVCFNFNIIETDIETQRYQLRSEGPWRRNFGAARCSGTGRSFVDSGAEITSIAMALSMSWRVPTKRHNGLVA